MLSCFLCFLCIFCHIAKNSPTFASFSLFLSPPLSLYQPIHPLPSILQSHAYPLIPFLSPHTTVCRPIFLSFPSTTPHLSHVSFLISLFQFLNFFLSLFPLTILYLSIFRSIPLSFLSISLVMRECK